MAQASHPTLINLPPPGSNPETPSEMPGTPTSTTTSLSTLSTTAIKDGHRGYFPQGPGPLGGRGHQHNPSATSLEAERADRISRLAGLERVSTLRAPPQHSGSASAPLFSSSQHATPTAVAGFPPNYPAQQQLTPAYFDSNGQPVAVTKMSTVGSASATESRTTAGERDEDMLSTDTNYREGESVASMGPDPDPDPDPDRMDEDLDGLSRAYDDRMSDDGSASLVGFGEGAGSTVSGPIYHRRPAPASQPWAPERSSSGLSSDLRLRDRETPTAADPAATSSAMQERRDARAIDGVAADHLRSHHPLDPHGGGFVDTTFRPLSTQGPDPLDRMVQRLDSGASGARPGPSMTTLGSSGRSGEHLAKFHFEGEKRDD